MKRTGIAVGLLLFLLLDQTAFAQVDARMFRYPDVSGTDITFVYAGDIWIAPKSGGAAVRLSSPDGEESFPRFSPDGSMIAFSGNYDGNTDVYTIPARGGTPVRVTHHPMPDRVVEWHPDGRRILYASSRESGKQRFNQFYLVARTGGLSEKLVIPYGEFGSLSSDGRMLAYTTKARDFRNWKRYRGGMNPDILIFDLETFESANITNNPAFDSQPMWHGDNVYFLSDSGPELRNNLWVFDSTSETLRQITHYSDFDIHFPSSGPDDIVFEAGGKLYLMDYASEEPREIQITVTTDNSTLKPRMENVSSLVQSAGISPAGKRAVVEARGDVFTLPAENGVVRNLTMSPGSAERYPAWSPDGKEIAYWSDATGEYELTVRSADGSGEPQTVSNLGPGYRYSLHWSPDSKKLAFVDQSMSINVMDRASGRVTEIDKGLWMYEGGLQAFRVSWSSDSRWVAYSRGLSNRHAAVFIYDTLDGELHQATSGYYSDSNPVFDPDGDYLYVLSNRSFSPTYGDVDNSFVYPNTTNVAAITLRKDVPSPLTPRNDSEVSEDEDGEEGGEGEEAAEEKSVEIDFDGFERRLVTLPPEAGNYTNLSAVSGKVLFRRLPRSGSGESASPIVFYDLKEREENTVVDSAGGFSVSADGKKLIVSNSDSLYIVDVAAGQSLTKALGTAGLEMMVDPLAEWKQIFNDTWRFQRDFFYDPGMHGVDWEAMRAQYGALIENAVTRWDVNYVLGELIAELNASHTYRGGGDVENAAQRGVGLLGVDWEMNRGRYRVAKIIDGGPWDNEVRSPLSAPGVDISEGDYVLAVNGIEMDASRDPWAAFEGLAGETVALTVNDEPTLTGAREVIVETLADETRLRNLEWIESNRKRVEEATDGRIGYIYVPDTGTGGQTELVRQFSAQFDKEGLIIDERFNSGGQIPDRFIELLNRPPVAFWSVRDGVDWQWPPVANFGPKVMLINGWSGSGGDAFPDYFRKAELGPLIGTTTWGGLIGISGAPTLVDGGSVTVPTFRMYNQDGSWFDEGRGVQPDIEVIDDPSQMALGIDPQLEAAINEVLRLLEEMPDPTPDRPGYEDRTRPTPTIRPPKG